MKAKQTIRLRTREFTLRARNATFDPRTDTYLADRLWGQLKDIRCSENDPCMRIMSTAARFRELGKKIICVGRNYGAHAKELGNPIPEKPILFLKPTSSYVSEGSPIQIPKGCGSLHHEVELGVVIERSGKNISESSALDHIGGYILALDMTARDFQDEAKKKGQPWTVAKGFDTACPVSDFIPRDKVPDPQNIGLWCKVNGTTRQDGNTKDMMFSIPNLISYISQYFTLEPGDVILTGTPSGVGPTGAGDTIQCGLADIVSMQFTVASSQ